jgi:hypothetical protein
MTSPKTAKFASQAVAHWVACIQCSGALAMGNQWSRLFSMTPGESVGFTGPAPDAFIASRYSHDVYPQDTCSRMAPESLVFTTLLLVDENITCSGSYATLKKE